MDSVISRDPCLQIGKAEEGGRLKILCSQRVLGGGCASGIAVMRERPLVQEVRSGTQSVGLSADLTPLLPPI